MRLLNTDKLEVVVIPEDATPPYAILSHTWGADEVSLQDMDSLRAENGKTDRQGFKKVVDAANLAASHGYRWIWIDTCCIDKTSSAELSEAINSMYRWYENATVCYAHIEDCPEINPDLESHPDAWTLQNTRWATRGWTLQELIAPKVVLFYTKEWKFLGQKRDPSVCEALVRTTGIEAGVLLGQITVAEVSVANRLKWAAKRRTTRPEDLAYCLMGLFEVNMPLLYGEGRVRAFIRLQEQILKITDDQSIFAWQLHSQGGDESMYGLLATSPSYFEGIPSIYLMPTGFQSTSSVPWSMTNKGLNVQLYIRPELDTTEEEYLAILDCFQDIGAPENNINREFQAYSPAIHLRRLWGDQYTRIRAHVCESVGERARYGGGQETFFVKQNPDSTLPSVMIDGYARLEQTVHSWSLQEVFPRDMWNSETGQFRLSLYRAHGIQGLFRFRQHQDIHQTIANSKLKDESLDVAVVLHRTARADLEAVCFPRPLEESTVEQAYYRLNRIWTKASREEQDQLFGEYQERIMAVPEMVKAVRAGRGLYLLNLRERFELETDITLFISELDGSSLDEDSSKQAHSTSLLEGSIPEQLKYLIGHELESLLQALDIWPHPECHGFRQRLEEGARDIANIVAPGALEICSAIINGNKLEVDDLLERVNVSNIKGPVSTFEGFHVIHVATFTPDVRIMSTLLEKGLDPLAVTEQGLNSFQLASICGKDKALAALLQVAPQPEEYQMFATDYEQPSYEKAVSRFRPYFGLEAHLQDTALHLAAVYCSADEFERIIEEILKATRIPISDWTSSEITLEWEYLISLRNSHGATVLHRAAIVANRAVVRLICERIPQASTRLDSTGRSALWYAAYGGDQEIVNLIAGAHSRHKHAPILHLSDDNGVTPLHAACCRGHSDCVKELLTLGATSSSKTRELDLTPVHYAALLGYGDCLRILVDEVWRSTRSLWKVATLLDMRASNGPLELFAPIHLAAANGWLECVRVLALNGASTSAKSSFHYRLFPGDIEQDMKENPNGLIEVAPSTPAEMAMREGHEAVCRFLEGFQPWSPSSASSAPSVDGRAELTHTDSVSSLEDWN